MILEIFTFEDLAIRSFLVQDENTKECVVIDSTRLIDPIKQYIQDKGLTLKAILETHVHADFISGSLELKEAFGGAPLIHCSEEAGPEWLPHYADVKVRDGFILKLGQLTFQAKFTPGHTPEHLSWLCFEEKQGADPFLIFTGDFLFANGVGRPDLLGDGNTPALLAELHKSLFERIASLPDKIMVYPSHGAGSLCGKSIGKEMSSTLGTERARNSALQPIDMKAWLFKMQEEMPAAPRAFYRNKRINLAGAPLMSSLSKDSMTPSIPELHRLVENGCIIDLRPPVDFGKAHLNGAINVPLGPSVGNWLAAILPPNEPILCILPDLNVQQRVTNLIRILGYDQKLTITLWPPIQEAGLPMCELQVLSSEYVHKALHSHGKEPLVIDVRSPAEWNSGHIEQAQHIELTRLQDAIGSLPRDREIVTVCHSGMRSSIAASILQKEGFEKVTHLNGGMTAWNAASLPTMKGEAHANSH